MKEFEIEETKMMDRINEIKLKKWKILKQQYEKIIGLYRESNKNYTNYAVERKKIKEGKNDKERFKKLKISFNNIMDEINECEYLFFEEINDKDDDKDEKKS